jgi:hypoxanthine phosphoribosyltransferase
LNRQSVKSRSTDYVRSVICDLKYLSKKVTQMSNNSYDYENRSNILSICWEDFHGICKALAKCIALQFDPNIILSIGRGGYYPGTLIAHILRIELHPIALSRRVNDIVKYDIPQWITEPPGLVKNKRVLIIDEISSTGATLRRVIQEVKQMKASDIKSAVLYSHTSGAAIPDYIGIISDAIILNPWDREVLVNGDFIFHPEYVKALSYQGIKPDDSYRIEASYYELAKQ